MANPKGNPDIAEIGALVLKSLPPELRGRPTSAQGKAAIKANPMKHSFYVHAGILCCKACDLKDTCPLRGKFKDDMGIEKCADELEIYEQIMAMLEEDIKDEKLKVLHRELGRIMAFDFLIYLRASRYIGDEGLATTIHVKDDKTGEVRKTKVQNILKKDMYYTKKSILEFMKSLKLNRDQGTDEKPFDLAITLTGKK